MTSIVKLALQELGAAGDFTDYPQSAIDGVIKYVADAPELTKFEGGKFFLCKKDKYYILKKDEVLVGWATVGDAIFDHRPYHTLDLIYVLPQYRHSKAALLLVYGIKELLTKPVIVDGALFTKGQELLNAVHARDRFKISTVDKKTGIKTPFAPTDISLDSSKNFVIVEGVQLGFFIDNVLPGNPSHKTYITLFEHLHDIEYN